MAIINTTNQPLISLYFCGGTGYNLGKKFTEIVANNEILKETVKIQYLDTSTGNNHEYNNEENTIVLGSGQGSGKVRGENASEIMESMTSTLHTFKPGIFNIGIGGASGGSGSTIMNCLSAALAERGIDMINVLVGSRASASEIKNTNKTFLSLANTVSVTGRPAVVHYRENNAKTTRADVDANILNNLTLMCLLFSGKDDKMDISDLRHLLNYPTVTNYPAAIVGFDLFVDKIELDKHEVMIAAASLGAPGSDLTVEPVPEYQTAGFIDEDVTSVFKDTGVMHWCVLGNTFTPLMKSLEQRVAEFDEAAKAVKLDSFVKAPVSDIKKTLVI